MTGFILRGLIAALGLWLATALVEGIHIDSAPTLIVAGLLLGLVNAVIRPLALILTLPFLILTIGLFLLVVNAAMLGLVAALLPGFHIEDFWSAFWGAVIVSLTAWVASWFIGPKGKVEVIVRRQ